MPYFRDIDCAIVPSSGFAPLKEYGTSRFDKSVACFVPSEPNVRFRVLLQTSIPYSDRLYDGIEALFDQGLENGSKTKPHVDFVAAIHLDGCETPDETTLLSLENDCAGGDISGYSEALLTGRCVKTADGNIARHGWVFQEIPLDTMLDGLLLDRGATSPSSQSPLTEDALVHAFQAASLNEAGGIDPTRNAMPTGLHAGQIQIRVYRATTAEAHVSPRNAAADLRTGASPAGVPHQIGFSEGRQVSALTRKIEYAPLDADDSPFATFTFYYRPAATLRRLKFDLPPRGPAPRSHADTLAALQPRAAPPRPAPQPVPAAAPSPPSSPSLSACASVGDFRDLDFNLDFLDCFFGMTEPPRFEATPPPPPAAAKPQPSPGVSPAFHIRPISYPFPAFHEPEPQPAPFGATTYATAALVRSRPRARPARRTRGFAGYAAAPPLTFGDLGPAPARTRSWADGNDWHPFFQAQGQRGAAFAWEQAPAEFPFRRSAAPAAAAARKPTVYKRAREECDFDEDDSDFDYEEMPAKRARSGHRFRMGDLHRLEDYEDCFLPDEGLDVDESEEMDAMMALDEAPAEAEQEEL